MYCSNSYATFNHDLLRLCGDIIPILGPTNKKHVVQFEQIALLAAIVECTRWCHIKCGGISVKQYKEFDARQSFTWICPPCLNILQQLPFANASFADTRHETILLPGYQKLALDHAKDFKMGHINANSIGGLKFEEIRHWLEFNYFDLLVITVALATTLNKAGHNLEKC